MLNDFSLSRRAIFVNDKNRWRKPAQFLNMQSPTLFLVFSSLKEFLLRKNLISEVF